MNQVEMLNCDKFIKNSSYSQIVSEKLFKIFHINDLFGLKKFFFKKFRDIIHGDPLSKIFYFFFKISPLQIDNSIRELVESPFQNPVPDKGHKGRECRHGTADDKIELFPSWFPPALDLPSRSSIQERKPHPRPLLFSSR